MASVIFFSKLSVICTLSSLLYPFFPVSISPGIGLCAGSGELQGKREEQLLSGVKGAARVYGQFSRMWCQKPPGGCHFRADDGVRAT